jgi:hypothetical protein
MILDGEGEVPFVGVMLVEWGSVERVGLAEGIDGAIRDGGARPGPGGRLVGGGPSTTAPIFSVPFLKPKILNLL